LEAVVISMLLCMAVDPEPPSDRDLRQKSGGGVPGVIGRLLLLVNSPGKRYGELAEGTFGIFRSIATDENGLIEKVEQSIPSLISCGRCMNGVTRSLQTPSRSDPSLPAAILTLDQGLP
jgi:hypothetical protein